MTALYNNAPIEISVAITELVIPKFKCKVNIQHKMDMDNVIVIPPIIFLHCP